MWLSRKSLLSRRLKHLHFVVNSNSSHPTISGKRTNTNWEANLCRSNPTSCANSEPLSYRKDCKTKYPSQVARMPLTQANFKSRPTQQLLSRLLISTWKNQTTIREKWHGPLMSLLYPVTISIEPQLRTIPSFISLKRAQRWETLILSTSTILRMSCVSWRGMDISRCHATTWLCESR